MRENVWKKGLRDTCGGVLALAALAAASGCGRGGGVVASTAMVPAAPVLANRPLETAVVEHGKIVVDPDHDDHITEGLGHAAPQADEHAVVAAVRAYYATAAAGDGAKGCAMLSDSLARSVPQAYGGPNGPYGLRGTTCSVVLSELFARERAILVAETPSLVATKVRLLTPDEGFALLLLKTTPEPRLIGVRREGSKWKMTSMLDARLP